MRPFWPFQLTARKHLRLLNNLLWNVFGNRKSGWRILVIQRTSQLSVIDLKKLWRISQIGTNFLQKGQLSSSTAVIWNFQLNVYFIYTLTNIPEDEPRCDVE